MNASWCNKIETICPKPIKQKILLTNNSKRPMHEYHNQIYNKFLARISWLVSTKVRSFKLLPCHSHGRKFPCILIQYWLKQKKKIACFYSKQEWRTCDNSKWGLLRRTSSLKLDNLIQMCITNEEELQNSEKSNF